MAFYRGPAPVGSRDSLRRTVLVKRIARRDKKAFLNDQCKEIEENNKMGKTRDIFKKIRDTKGTSHKDGHKKEKAQK